MPNTTSKDISYAGDFILLREISSPTYTLEGRIARVHDFINILSKKTGIPFSLLRSNDYSREYWSLYTECNLTPSHFDEEDLKSTISFKITANDYKTCTLNSNSHIFLPNRNEIYEWICVNNDYDCLPYEASLDFMKQLIESRYNGSY